jgi:hypothetical protein
MESAPASTEKLEVNEFKKLNDRSDQDLLPDLSNHVLIKLQDVKELQALYHNPEIDEEMKQEIAIALNEITKEVDLLDPNLQIRDFKQKEEVSSNELGYLGVFQIETSSGIQDVKIGFKNEINNELELVILNLE